MKYCTGDENQLLMTGPEHCCAGEQGWNARSQDTQEHEQDVPSECGLTWVMLVSDGYLEHQTVVNLGEIKR